MYSYRYIHYFFPPASVYRSKFNVNGSNITDTVNSNHYRLFLCQLRGKSPDLLEKKKKKLREEKHFNLCENILETESDSLYVLTCLAHSHPTQSHQSRQCFKYVAAEKLNILKHQCFTYIHHGGTADLCNQEQFPYWQI